MSRFYWLTLISLIALLPVYSAPSRYHALNSLSLQPDWALPYFEKYKHPRTPQESRLHFFGPALKELRNGSLARFLLRLLQQQVHPSRIEVDIAINNATVSAKNRDEAFRDNQDTIAVIRYLSGDGALPNDPPLPTWQAEVFEYVKFQKLSVRFVDLTRGYLRSIGLFRNLAAELALSNYRAPQDDGYLWSMDFDTQLPPGTLRYVMAAFEAFPELESAFVNIAFTQPEVAPLASVSAASNWEAHFLARRFPMFHLLYNFSVGGPQMITRISTFRRLEGFPITDTGEDVQFSAMLKHLSRSAFLPAVTVRTADRARPESYQGANRLADLKSGWVWPAYPSEILRWLRGAIQQLSEDDSELRDSKLRDIFTWYGIPFRPDIWRTVERSETLVAVIRYLRALRSDPAGEKRIGNFSNAIESFYTLFDLHLTDWEKAFLRDLENDEQRRIEVEQQEFQSRFLWIGEQISRDPERSLHELLTFEEIVDNEWLIQEIESAEPGNRLQRWGQLFTSHAVRSLTGTSTANSITDDNRRHLVRLRALYRFAESAANSPALFPKANSVFRHLLLDGYPEPKGILETDWAKLRQLSSCTSELSAPVNFLSRMNN